MPRLTEQEQQDIIRFIEEDKPLPEKYRFLLFDDKREVELVWNDKTSEVCNVVLPFQIIEHVDEPRAEKEVKLMPGLFDPKTGRQATGWTNKLIWGDNKLILSSLKNGPLREEIEAQGGIKLIYIDPPFDVGADFSMDIEIGDDTFTKEPNILEEIAFRDTWGKLTDSFIPMIYERLSLMHGLLADDGSIYVHCDWRVSGYIRLVLDEIFGKNNFLNEIIWHYPDKLQGNIKGLPKNHDTIFLYQKTPSFKWNGIKILLDKPRKINRRIWNPDTQKLDTARDEMGNVIYDTYTEKNADDVLTIPQAEVTKSKNKTGYPTEKPKSLLEYIIKASSNKDELIADFFCGSGTTAAVAERLGRKWIAADLGKFGIHTTRKRMIDVQRALKDKGKKYRAFCILNLGKYERQHYIGVNLNLREEQQQQQIAEKATEFVNLILGAYHADKVDGFPAFHGKKAGRMVVVGPVNLPVTGLFVEEIIVECRKKHITKVDILGFEFEMGLFPGVREEAQNKGIDFTFKHIPRDVFDKQAVDKGQVVFHDVAFIEIKPHIDGNRLTVELTDFSVFYSQGSIAEAEKALEKKKVGNQIVAENGQVIKVSKNALGNLTREVLTKSWTDWIDYWSVDFDFESKREIIRVPRKRGQSHLKGMEPPQMDLPEYEEIWTKDYIFENEWQSFRTKKDRSLELKSAARECLKGRRKIAVKVVDIFGNDTMNVIEVTI